MLNLETVELIDVSDADLEVMLASSGKGKPAVYAPILTKLNQDVAADRNVSLTVNYKEINETAKERQAVLAGIRQACKKHPAGSRFHFMASGENDVRILIGKVKPVETTDKK